MKNPLLVVSLVLLFCFVFGYQNKAEKAELGEFGTQAKVKEQNEAALGRLLEERESSEHDFR